MFTLAAAPLLVNNVALTWANSVTTDYVLAVVAALHQLVGALLVVAATWGAHATGRR